LSLYPFPGDIDLQSNKFRDLIDKLGVEFERLFVDMYIAFLIRDKYRPRILCHRRCWFFRTSLLRSEGKASKKRRRAWHKGLRKRLRFGWRWWKR
jgi:hypothetical protein